MEENGGAKSVEMVDPSSMSVDPMLIHPLVRSCICCTNNNADTDVFDPEDMEEEVR